MPLVELDPDILDHTAHQLHERIAARFPGSGLEQRAVDLTELLVLLRRRAVEISRPIWWVRVLYGLVAMVVVAVALVALPDGVTLTGLDTAVARVQFVESAVNDLIFLGAGLLFVSTLETRLKRRWALRELHEIRSFAHVIDMMQLTKDPQRVPANADRATPASPPASYDPFELGRYLDYCSELLSLSAKGAALMAQRFDDPAVLGAVNEIENLTNGLSRKIWQKLMILASTEPEAM
jgi:hypothetical protein